MKLKIISVMIAFAIFSPAASAQTSAAPAPKQLTNQDLVDIEELYKSSEQQPVKPPPAKKTDELSEADRKELEDIQNSADYKNSKLKSVTDLTELSPFQDVSVIQRKFLPKTERFQVFTSLGISTNSPWFNNIGGKVNASYNFTEKWGVEFSGMFLSRSEKDAAREIRKNNSLEPERFVLMKANAGIDVIWSPIYGKISKLNEEIIPFDMYFAVGGGMSLTNSQEKNVPAVHLATGQIFALSKGMAFRWDYSWYMYQATPERDSISTSPPVKNSYNDLIFSAGVSFFFPEVSYR